MSTELQVILGELKARLSDHYGERLERLVLFGSQARGDAEPDSDIDVLVVLRGEVDTLGEIHRTGKLMSDLSLQFDTVISATFVAQAEYEHRNSPLMLNVRREGVRI